MCWSGCSPRPPAPRCSPWAAPRRARWRRSAWRAPPRALPPPAGGGWFGPRRGGDVPAAASEVARMKVLVLNCGSSSLKFQLIETDGTESREGRDRTLAKGLVEDAGGTAVLHVEAEGKKPVRDAIGAFQHRKAVERALAVLTDPENGVIPHKDEIGAVGHRVVHGGEQFQSSVLIDDKVIEGIEAMIALAPLHNPANLQGYYAARAELPNAPQVAVFDTSFHHSMPQEAYLYGLPYSLYQRFGIRRFGFHGTSPRFVAGRLPAPPPPGGGSRLRATPPPLR